MPTSCVLFLHMPNCVIIILLYVFNWIFLFFVAANCSFLALGNNLLYKCKGIMFPSLPVSTLCGTIIETWFDVFRFVVITNCLLLKIINLYSLYQYDLLHGVGLQLCFAGILACVCSILRLCLCPPFIAFILSNSFVLLKLVIIADWALWASTLLAQINTCLLFTVVPFLALLSSLIISASISLSLSLCTNCSFHQSIYLFMVTFYSCQSKSALPFFCIFICLSA